VYANFPAMASTYYVVATCNDNATSCRAWFSSSSQVGTYLLGSASGTISVLVIGFV
jgi:hypothetical protein